MSQMVCWEFCYVGYCILWGIILSVIYDLLRIIRIAFHEGMLRRSITDLLYWIFAALGTFYLCYWQDNGVVRGFAIAIILLTMFCFDRWISKITVPFLGHVLEFPVQLIWKILHKTTNWVKKKVKNAAKQLKSIVKNVTIKRDAKR